MVTDVDLHPKVVAVPTGFQLIINRGTDGGVKIGQKYLIYRRGEELFDPDNNESLGEYEIVVGRATVVLAKEKNATLESAEFDLIEWERGGLGALSYAFPGEKRKEKQMQPLDAEVGDFAKRI